LKKLSLKHNQLKSLPPEIGDLTELKELYLEYNKLESLPSEIGKLKNLEFLYLNDNKLKSIPREIGYMENLRFLIIGKNSLTDLPDEIGNLFRLTELDVAYCGPMVRIPETIKKCKRLDYIYVDKSILLPFTINSVNPRLRVLLKENGVLN
jgi:Leucine-rich repeat (LRR) protein